MSLRALGIARSLAIYWRPGRQRALRAFYAPFVRPGDLVFDVGAHVGDRTAAFSALGAEVIAVEPQPDLIPWLRRRVGRRPGVTIVECALGRAGGSGRLAVSDATPTVSTLADAWRGRVVEENPTFSGVTWDRSVEVPVRTLDSLIGAHGMPSFCKIDVEGHEAEVLAGLSRPVEALSVEFVAGGLDVATACVERLEGLGAYEFNVVIGEERAFAFDRWQEAAAIIDWLNDGASGASSGDLYARIVGSRRASAA